MIIIRFSHIDAKRSALVQIEIHWTDRAGLLNSQPNTYVLLSPDRRLTLVHQPRFGTAFVRRTGSRLYRPVQGQRSRTFGVPPGSSVPLIVSVAGQNSAAINVAVH